MTEETGLDGVDRERQTKTGGKEQKPCQPFKSHFLGSVVAVEHLASMCEGLGSIPGPAK